MEYHSHQIMFSIGCHWYFLANVNSIAMLGQSPALVTSLTKVVASEARVMMYPLHPIRSEIFLGLVSCFSFLLLLLLLLLSTAAI